MALNWDISLQQMWDFEYGFKKLLRPKADEYVRKVIDYWTSYEDDSVELCRRGSDAYPQREMPVEEHRTKAPETLEPLGAVRLSNASCGWKNIGSDKAPIGNQACKGDKEEKLMARRRYPILKSQECGDLTGRLIGERVDGTKEGDDQPPPHLGVGDDDAGTCESRVDGVCMQRNTQVKSMHSLFFFGFPLRNVNPDWSGLAADQGRSEASDYIMEWIFNTYNDMLIKENRDAEGFRWLGPKDPVQVRDAYGQEKAEAEAEGRRTDFSAVMSPAVHHASKACLCTSLTTFFAFFSNASSCFASIRTFGLFCASLIISNFCIDFTFFLAIVCASERVKRKAAQSMPPKVQVEAQQEVRTFKLPLLGIFATFAVICMWTASYVTPDLKMPQVFSSNDNYERFLPVLSKRYEKKFNPYRLKVRIHLGVNADDPIDRGTTPDYNDCFFNCAGQKPNYVHLFATLGAGGLVAQSLVGHKPVPV
ncbi:unnamed protein product [Durusdinium trenchii]|uniref:SSD domain-containing protein n=1 Tax=Durusdinium trenchii TaxID=1381693 RepID=A0ABP0IX45_9DINO